MLGCRFSCVFSYFGRNYSMIGGHTLERGVCLAIHRTVFPAWQTINEVSGRKSTAKAKLKAASQQERIKLWEQHFKNLLGNPPEITDEPITRIISKQLDVKLGPFTKEELDTVLRRIKNRKAAGARRDPPRSVEDETIRRYTAPAMQRSL